MGEYATYMGREVKIGTCENMYYLRADQAAIVSPTPIKYAESIRFRFPFPDEDHITPGDFENHWRTVPVWGAEIPEGVEHGNVQFVAQAGYNVCLPCPESEEAKKAGYHVHRNGFRGAVHVVQQRVWNGHLAIVCMCGGCETLWRCPELEDAQPIIDVLRSEGERKRAESDRWNQSHPDQQVIDEGKWWDDIADRVIAGYVSPPAWVENVKVDA